MENYVLLKSNVGEIFFVENSSIARCVRLRTIHDPGVQFLMLRYVDKLSPFFDIGANVGLFSILASTISGPDCRIVAFEPDAENIVGLRKNIEIKGASNIAVVEKAVSYDDNPLIFGKIDCGVARKSKEGAKEIPCRSIDSFVAETGIVPSFMKIDVEGAETGVIKGAENTLSKYDCMVEMEFSFRDLKGDLDYFNRYFLSMNGILSGTFGMRKPLGERF